MNNYHGQIHELKCHPSYFTLIMCGDKAFELRKDDRGYKRDDLLILREYDPEADIYTGYVICAVVTCVVRGEWLAPGYVALGLSLLARAAREGE